MTKMELVECAKEWTRFGTQHEQTPESRGKEQNFIIIHYFDKIWATIDRFRGRDQLKFKWYQGPVDLKSMKDNQINVHHKKSSWQDF